MRRACIAAVFVAAVAVGMPAEPTAVGPIPGMAAACAPLPAGLTHWWHGDGNTNDSVGGDHGTAVGTVTYAPGVVGQAFQFGSGYLSLSQSYGGAPLNEFTVMGWIQTQQSGPDLWQAILSSTDGSFVHFQTADAGGAAVYTDAGFHQIGSFGSLPTGAWRHVALTARSGEIRVYQDAAIVGQSAPSFSSITHAAQVLIGRGYAGGRPFPGLVDELQVYERALTSAEVAAAYAAGTSGFCSPQIADGDVNGLIAAIIAANTNPGPDAIALAPGGTYTLTTNYDATNGLPVITDALTITGNGAVIERSQAAGTPDFRVLSVQTAQSTDVVTLSDVTIRGGAGAASFEGGGLRVVRGVLNLLDGGRVTNNRATFGGGIWTAAQTTLNVTRSTIADNVADDGTPSGVGNGHGGGIYSYGTVSVVESSVSGNTARLQGGGIFSQGGGTLNVVRSTISGNTAHSAGAPTAGYAGGILNWIGSTATVANSTIAGNFTNFGGGGIRNVGTLTVLSSTIALNHSSQYGSGLLTDANGMSTLGNTLLAGNFLGRNCNYAFSGSIVSLGSNLSDDGTCAAVFTQAGDRNSTPGGLDPAGLADNSGPTRTIALTAGSAAIDGGNDARCAAAPVANQDQRGTPRPAAVHCDIGAFELQQSPGQGAWLPKNTMPTARLGAAGAALNGRMYVIGGSPVTWDFHSIGTKALRTVEAYDPATNTWTTAADLPFARVYPNGAAALNGKIYMQGGAGCDAPSCRESSTLLIFDPSAGPAGSWTVGPPMPIGAMSGMTGAIDGKLYVLVGWSVGAPRNDFWRFDPATSAWTQMAFVPRQHDFGAGAVVGGRFYATGGEFSRDILSVFDPVTNTWTSETMPLGYQHHAAIAVGDWLVLAGGSQFVGGSVVSNQMVVAYDTVSRTWTTASPVPATGGPYSGAAGVPVMFNGASSGTFARLPDGLDLTVGAGLGPGAYIAGGFQISTSQVSGAVFGMNPVQRDAHTYAWDFGDGTQGTGPTPTHAYTSPGTYVATLTVTTPDGRSGSATTTVTVSALQPQTITFTSTPPVPALVGGRYAVAAVGGASGNPVVFTSLTPSVCTVSGDVVTFASAGACTIAADQAGGGGYVPATQATQSLTVETPPDGATYHYLGNQLENCGGTNDPCGRETRVRGWMRMAQPLGPNLAQEFVTPDEFQFGDGRSVVISSADTLAVRTFQVSTDAQGNIHHWTVVLSVNVDPGGCVNDNVYLNTYHNEFNGQTGDAACYLTDKNQPGQAWGGAWNFDAAGSWTSYISAPQQITFTSTPPAPALVGHDYLVSATGGGSGNPVTFSTTTPGVCSTAGDVVSFIGVGACVIAANQAGGGGYLAAPEARQTVMVTSMPTLTLPGDLVVEAAGPGGSFVSYVASSTDPFDPAPSLTCAPVSGATFAIGTTSVTCSATNTFGNTVTGTFSVTVRDTVAPAIVALLSPNPDDFILSATTTVVVRLTDAVGVADVSVNGVSFSLQSGGPTDGTWTGSVLVTPFEVLTLGVTSRDGSINTSTRSFVVDNDGIAGAIDRSRTDYATDLSAVYSSTFNDGVTSGERIRFGTPVISLDGLASGWVRGRNVGTVPVTPTSAAVEVCGGPVKRVWLDQPTEEALVKCAVTGSPSHPRLTVFAVRALPVVDVVKYERICNFSRCVDFTTYIRLGAGQQVTTGSPAEADPLNTEAIAVEVRRVEADGSETLVATYSLDPGETAEGSILPGETPADDRVVVSVLAGEVTVTLGSDVVTVAEGETVTSRVEQLAQVITFAEIPNKLFGDPAFAPGAAASSGLPVSYAVTGACTLSGNMVTPAGTGVCTVTASQPGNLDYLAAAPVGRTFGVWHGWSGLLQPVNAAGSSVFKTGSTVPLKFELTGASAAVTNLQPRLYIAKISDSVVGTEVEAVGTSAADAGNTFRYANGQYIFNWGTKGLSDGTWQIRVDLLDGHGARVVVVSLKK